MYRIKKASIFDPVSKTLNQELFSGEKLRPEARLDLLTQITDYTKVRIYEAYILGSMLGYQYSPTSDIDVWVIVDDAKVTPIESSNGKLLKGTQHPVNLRLMTLSEMSPDQTLWPVSYSIFKDTWVNKSVKPSKQDIHRFDIDLPYLKLLKRSMDRQTKQMFNAINTPRLEKETRDVADIYAKLDNSRRLAYIWGLGDPKKSIRNAAYKYVEHKSTLGENADRIERFVRKVLDKNK